MIGRIWTRICQHIVRRGSPPTVGVDEMGRIVSSEIDRVMSRAGGRP